MVADAVAAVTAKRKERRDTQDSGKLVELVECTQQHVVARGLALNEVEENWQTPIETF